MKWIRLIPALFYFVCGPGLMVYFQWAEGPHNYPPIAVFANFMSGIGVGLSIAWYSLSLNEDKREQ
jgi:hypothetical protein